MTQKKFSIKKLSDTELASLFSRTTKVLIKHEKIFYAKFEELHEKLSKEIDERNRGRIYREACYSLKNNGRNQFRVASQYANAVMNSCDYFSDQQSHEIGSFYTKTKCPVLVDLIMRGYYPFS